MKINYLAIFIVMVSTFACTSNVPTYQGEIPCTTIHVDVSSPDFLTHNNVIDKKIIQLETTDESVFGDISKLLVADDRIFILDGQVAQGLFVFDMQGNFLFNVGRRGGGPGEFYSINDFFLDTLNRSISIYDANMRKLYYYDWTGKYTHTHDFSKLWLFACCPLDSKTFALDFTKTALFANRFHLLLVDDDNEAFFRYKPLEMDYGLANNFHIAFYSGHNKTYYVPTLCDTIFEIDTTGIVGGIHIDFGKSMLPHDFLKDVRHSEHAKKLLSSRYCYGVKDISETTDMLSFIYHYGDHKSVAFYDKKSQKTYNAIAFFPMPLTSYNDYFVGINDYVYDMKQTTDKNFKDHFIQWKDVMGEENWSLIDNVKEADNPLVILYKIDTQ